MDSIDQFLEEIDELGKDFPPVSATWSKSESGDLVLETIICKAPGQGIGSAYMTEALARADVLGLRVRLDATPIGDLEPRMSAGGYYAIEDWYGVLGFEYEGEDFEGVWMTRSPRPAPAP